MKSLGKMDLQHLIGRQVGSATLLKEIGRGGMGAVFSAYQRTLKRTIAVKILPKSTVTPTIAQVFQQEAEAAAILSHPNIIAIYEVGEQEDFLFFTMQWVKGKPLSRYIKMAQKNVLPSRRILPLKTTLKTIVSVLDALDYAHRQDIVHRDIKPDNILIDSETDRPIISDFGIAQVSSDLDDGITFIMGTPRYMAPEQMLNTRVDGRADIYAMGTVLYEMLTPCPLPFADKTVKKIMEMKLRLKDKLFDRKPSQLNPMLDEGIDQVVFRALAFDPERRFPTCREFSETLQQAMKQCMHSRETKK